MRLRTPRRLKQALRGTTAFSRGPIAQDSIRSVAIRLTGLSISLVQSVLTARLLGAEGYGVTSVALSAMQVVATLALFGFGPLAVRELARTGTAEKESTTADFLSMSLRWVAVSALLGGGVLSAAALTGLVPETYRAVIIVSGLVVLPLALLQLQRGVAQGLGRISAAQIPGEVLRPALFAGFLILAFAVQWRLDPQAYIIAFAACAFVAITLFLAFTPWAVAALRTADPVADRRRRWRKGAMPFLAISIVSILQGELATLMLGALSSPEQAGLFQPVLRLAPLIALPMNAVAMSYAPRLAAIWHEGERAKAARVTHIFTLTTFAAGLLIFAAIMLLTPFLLWLFGPEFAKASPLLRLYSAGMLFVAACGPAGAILTMVGQPRQALLALICGVAAQAGVGVLAIPSGGAYGATVAITSGTILTWIIMLFAARRAVGMDPSLFTALASLRAVRRSQAGQSDD